MKTSSLVCLAALAAACASTPPAPKLEQIVEQHVAARGGRAAIEAVKVVRIGLTIQEADADSTVDADYLASREGRMRIDILANGTRIYSEGIDARGAWEWVENNLQSTGSSPAGAAALRRGLEAPMILRGLHELAARGHVLTLLPAERIDDIDYHVIAVRFADGYVTRYYVNPKTGLIDRRRDTRPLHPDVDPTPTQIEERYFDWREFAGVRYPMASTQTDLASGKQLQKTLTRSLAVNPPLAPNAFDRP
jgi:hypothetical protein